MKREKRQDLQKPFQGRGINVSDLRAAGMGGTKLVSDKAHRDGSPSRRNRVDVKKTTNPGGVHTQEKQVATELKKSSFTKKSRGTPMKMLMAQEMSKETESKRKQSNVVARLMGLDEPLSTPHSTVNDDGSFRKSGRSSRVTLAGALQNCREDSYAHEKEYRDVYEVWQPHSERRMALVRQKFIEAKRLATDEKLLQSKEFQDALEILSSNQDLFLKFLEEPNSLFAKHLKELHSIPPPPQTKRITVLKPLRTVESNEGGWDLNKLKERNPSVSQPTRIVILKPSPGKTHGTNPKVMPNISSPVLMERDDFYQNLGSTRVLGSREAAKDFARQMRDSLSSNSRDESLLSSVLSNGYVGDEETEYIEEDGNFSDSEIPTPTSRHFWDYSNRFGSPCSVSSFSRTSYSPEPSVIREAKKRLSERWAMVASNGKSNQDKMEVSRSSSTLGEMLAINDVKKGVSNGALTVSSSRSYGGEQGVSNGALTVSSSRSYGGEQDLTVSTSSQTKDENGKERSPKNLSRSKSVPVSPSTFKNIGLYSEEKPVVAKELTKLKSGRSLFKGKVSSLFFLKNKKGVREKSVSSPLVTSENRLQSGSAESVNMKSDEMLHPVYNSEPEDSPLVHSEEESIKASSPALVKDQSKQGSLSFRDALSLEKPNTSERFTDNPNEPSSSTKTSRNQDQPSPTSILDAPFEDDTNNTTPNSSEVPSAVHSLAPIESVARLLEWEDVHLETPPNTSKFSRNLAISNSEDDQLFLFVQKLLATAGLDKEKVITMFIRWHSVDNPLDPILLEKFLDRKEEDAKNRERRSNQRLLFDCVNSALLDVGWAAFLGAYPWARACNGARKKAVLGAHIGDEVWVLIRGWFSGEGKSEAEETDNGSLVVDRLLRREVGGSGWTELMNSEIDEISEEIGGKVLEELVGEVLDDLAVGCLL